MRSVSLLAVTLLAMAAAPLLGAVAPSSLRTAAPYLNSNSMELSYDDNSDDEDGFEFQYSADGVSGWATLGTALRNQTLISSITGGVPDTTYYFRVRATSTASGNSDWTEAVPVTLPSGIAVQSRTFQGGTVGEPLAMDPLATYGNAPVSWSATDLPPGLELDPETGAISGTPTTPGVFRPRVAFTDGATTTSAFVTFRIVPAPAAPVVMTPFPAILLLAPADPVTVDLEGHFADPDTGEAVRIDTNLGVIDTILHSSATPATVENFLSYVDRGDYDEVVFHRSAVTVTSGVAVVQAGLARADGDDYATFPHDPDVVDEPGLSNLTGSFAMAKTSSPNSGSSQWYFNVIDNTNLDGPQSNGGYTVFGRAATPSLPVIAGMHAQARGNYTINLNGSPTPFSDWPTITAPAGAAPTPEESIRISSIRRIEALTYAIASNDNPAFLAATLEGSQLVLHPAPDSRGTATVEIEASDLDRNTTPAAVTVRVLELDLSAGLGPRGRLAASFNHEKNVPGLEYEVQRSGDLQTWSTVWKTSDGLGAPEVIGTVDLGAEWRLTVEDPAALPAGAKESFLRVVATASP